MKKDPVNETDFRALRREVKILLVDRDMDCARGRRQIAASLAERLGRPVSMGTLSHAMTGCRPTRAYRNLLAEMKQILCVERTGENLYDFSGEVN